MRILERGSPPEERVYRSTCSHCKTKYEYMAKEVECVSNWKDGTYLKFPCEVCGRDVTQDIDKPYVPPHAFRPDN